MYINVHLQATKHCHRGEPRSIHRIAQKLHTKRSISWRDDNCCNKLVHVSNLTTLHKVIQKLVCNNINYHFTTPPYIINKLSPYGRATDKVRKSVITHWKLVKTHWKNKQCVKIRISIPLYAFGVQSSAYWLAKLKLWNDDVHLSVRLSTYCQSFPLHYNEWYYKNKCLQYNTTSNSKILPNICLKWHKTTDMRFKTVIPSLLCIAKKYRGWNTTLRFENQHWVKN